MEIANKNGDSDFFYSLETKRNWRSLVDYRVDSPIIRVLREELKRYALNAFREFGCRDIARIDFKVSEDNKVFFLEINPLPGLSPEYSDLVIMSRKLGRSYQSLIGKTFLQALWRCGLAEEDKSLRRDNLRCQLKEQ
jgi:D-alanine-D-alanine ligase